MTPEDEEDGARAVPGAVGKAALALRAYVRWLFVRHPLESAGAAALKSSQRLVWSFVLLPVILVCPCCLGVVGTPIRADIAHERCHVMFVGPGREPQSMCITEPIDNGARCGRSVSISAGARVECVTASGDGTTEFVVGSMRSMDTETCCTDIVDGSAGERLAAMRRYDAAAVRHGLRIQDHATFGLLSLVLAVVVVAACFAALGALDLALRAARRLGLVLRYGLLVPRYRGNVLRRVGTRRIAVLSDLHVTGGENPPYELEGTAVGETLTGPEVLRRLARLVAAAGMADVLVVAGDVTDRGDLDEWAKATAILTNHACKEGLLAVPGNHDVVIQIKDGRSVDMPSPALREAMAGRAEANLAALMGPRWRSGGSMYPSLHEIASEGACIDVLLLDSNRYGSNFLLSNSIGQWGEPQLAAVASLLRARAQPERPLLVVTHHHPGWPHDRPRSPRDLFMIALDSHRLLALLRTHAANAPVLIVHGHKHMFFEGRFENGKVEVLGIPSSTLGCCATESSFPDELARLYLIDYNVEVGSWVYDVITA